MVRGTILIAQERDRQLAKGFTAKHDDTHDGGAILMAAMALIAQDEDVYFEYAVKPVDSLWIDKLTEKYRGNRIRSLVVAGAMIAAEIDRLTRLEAR